MPSKKMFSLQRWFFIVFVVLVLVVVLSLSALKLQPNKSKISSPEGIKAATQVTASTDVSYWERVISQRGPASAYDEFKRAYRTETFEKQHLAAHVFGRALYLQVGIDGIATCDADFAFGCFHSFFGQALADKGPGVVEQLDAACTAALQNAASGCQHGIGHGIMEYFGIDIGKALDLCLRTKQEQPLYGCSSGVFMEYNVPIVIDGASARTEPRSFDLKDKYEPCLQVPARFQESCYYELPQLWSKYTSDFAELGKYCAAITTRAYQDSCVKGIGNIVGPTTNYTVSSMVSLCSAMPGHSQVAACLATASWALFAVPGREGDASGICAGLSEIERKNCAI